MTAVSRTDCACKRSLRPEGHGVCVVGLLLLVATLSQGCATDRYFAATLPADFEAPPVENPQTVDLSRLSMSPPSSQRIDRGDVLEVTISAGLSDEDTFTFPVRVNEKGDANIPFVGSVALAGLELEGAEAAITAVCVQQQLYRAPHVTVTMKQQRMNRVTVVGAVKNPGIYSLPRGHSDLLAALMAAGDLAEDAGTHIEIRQPGTELGTDRNPVAARGEGQEGVTAAGYTSVTAATETPRSIRIDLISAAKTGTKGYYVDDGGVVMVERRDPEPVHVIGLVNKPGRYEFPVAEELRALDAIAQANGVSSTMADKIFVIRRVEGHSEPVLIQLSRRKAKRNGAENLRLMPGDIVSVEQTPATVLLDIVNVVRFGIGANAALF